LPEHERAFGPAAGATSGGGGWVLALHKDFRNPIARHGGGFFVFTDRAGRKE